MSLTLNREALTNQIADDLATRNANAGLIETAVNGLESAESALDGRVTTAEGEIDDLQTAETAIKGSGWTDENLVNHEGRITQNESDIVAIKGTGWTDENLVDHESRIDDLQTNDALQDATLGTLKETILSTKLAVNELERQAQIGNGATLDFSGIGIVALDARATGRANPTVEGRTATNIVDGEDIADLGTVTFSSVLDHKYYDVLHGTILTGTGSDMTVTNDTGATADLAVIYLTGVYGEDNEPTATNCAKIFSYFDGTKSIQLPARVRSVGKNLFNGELESGQISTSTGLDISQVYTSRTVNFIQIEPNADYSLSGTSRPLGATVAIFWYDKDLNYISYSSFPASGGTDTSPENARWCRFQYGAPYPNEYLPQLELGSTATTYEPYTDSTLYIADNEEVRSVPAISDEIKVVNGQLVKVGGVTSKILSSGDITNILTSPINVDYIIITQPSDWVLKGTTNRTNSLIFPDFRYYASTLIDNTAQIGSWSNYYNGVSFILIVAKGTYASLADAKTALAGTVIYYQLATPIITPLTTSGILQAKQNGTVYYEPYYEGSHQTNASSQITLPYTGTIEAVYSYDEDLVEYLLDSSEYSLTGTTLTITDALENEVFFVKMSRSEPLEPEMSVNVINNAEVAEDSVTGKFYKKTFTVADGVPTFGIEEVV